jgi:hypothetical protein
MKCVVSRITWKWLWILNYEFRTTCLTQYKSNLISNFRLVLNVVFFLLGDSPASDFFVPTLWNILSAPSLEISTIYEDGTECSKSLAHKIRMLGKQLRERILFINTSLLQNFLDWLDTSIHNIKSNIQNFSGLHHRGIKVMTLFFEWRKRRSQTVWCSVPKRHCWWTKKYIIIFIYCKSLKFYITYPFVPILTSEFPFAPPKPYTYRSLCLNYENHHVSSILYMSHTLQCIILHCHGHPFSLLMCSNVKERFQRLLVTWLQDPLTHSYSCIQYSRDPPKWI